MVSKEGEVKLALSKRRYPLRNIEVTHLRKHGSHRAQVGGEERAVGVDVAMKMPFGVICPTASL